MGSKIARPKRFLALFMAVCMSLSLLPMSVFATGATEDPKTVTIQLYSAYKATLNLDEPEATSNEATFSDNDVVAVTPAEGEDGDAIVEKLTQAKDDDNNDIEKTWIYNANKVNVTVNYIGGTLNLSGDIGTLTVNGDEGAPEEEEAAPAAQAEGDKEPGAVVVLQSDAEVASIAAGSTAYIAAGATVTVAGVDYVNAVEGDSETAVAITADGLTNVKFTGDNVKVTITGENAYTVTGTPNVTVSGTDAVTITGNVRDVSGTGTVNLDGALTGTATAPAAAATDGEADPTLTLKIGKTVAEDSTTTWGTALNVEAAKGATFTFANNTLTLTKDGTVTNKSTEAVAYDVTIETGTFNTSGKDITGKVTFVDNAVGAIVTGNTSSHLLKNVYIGDGAKATFDNLALTDTVVTYIGKNATITLAGSHADLYNSGIKVAASTNNKTTGATATFILDPKSDSNSLNGMIEPDTQISDLLIPDNANIKLKVENSSTSDTGTNMSKGITVGDNATLTIEGESTTNKLTINGSNETHVHENGTLELINVSHTRDAAVKDIETETGATVILDKSTTYNGATNGSTVLGTFQTGDSAADTNEHGLAKSVTVSYKDQNDKTEDIKWNQESFEAAAANVGMEQVYSLEVTETNGSDDSKVYKAILTTISYTSEKSSKDKTWSITVKENKYETELTNFNSSKLVEGTTLTDLVTYNETNKNFEYPTTQQDANTTVSRGDSPTTTSVAKLEIHGDSDHNGYGTAYVMKGYTVNLSATKDGKQVGIVDTGMLNYPQGDWDAVMGFGPIQSTYDIAFEVVNNKTESDTPAAAIAIKGEWLGEITGTVDLKNGVYDANFVVSPGTIMYLNLNNAAIGSGSTFDIGYGGKLVISTGTSGADSTTLTAVNGENAQSGHIYSAIAMTRSNSTLELNDGIVLDGAGRKNQDFASLEVAKGVQNAKVLVNGEVKIVGANNADEKDDAKTTALYNGHKHSTTHGAEVGEGANKSNQSALNDYTHSQSAGVYTEGQVEFIVGGATKAKATTTDAKLIIVGGTGETGADNDNTSCTAAAHGFVGGAGVYVETTGDVKFSGTGVIDITGGTGGVGGKGADANNSSSNGETGDTADAGARGGDGGAGIYNAGDVTVAMTSDTWSKGNVIVTGGKGGQGGDGHEAAQATHGNSFSWNDSTSTHTCTTADYTKGGTAGSGGHSGYAIFDGANNKTGEIIINSGVFLNYSGTVGTAGSVGSAKSATGTAPSCEAQTNQGSGTSSHNHENAVSCSSGHSDNGNAGSSGTDNKYAVVQATLTITGGTAYGFSGDYVGNNSEGDYGFSVTDLTVTGGTIYGSQKTGTGYDYNWQFGTTDNSGKTVDHVTDMLPTNVTQPGVLVSGKTTSDGDNATVTFARVKVGTEFAKYIVRDISIDSHGAKISGGETLTYGGANTGMYVNEQGFLYVYLPAGDKAELTLILQKDSATEDVWYKVTCGGTDATSVQDYGYGKVVAASSGQSEPSVDDSAINYDGNAVWGEPFLYGTEPHYNGIDMTFAETLVALESGATQEIKTDEQLATVAFLLNHTDLRADGFAGVTFKLAPDTTQNESNKLDISRLAWSPIGSTEKNPFKGTFDGDGKTIQGLRMADGFEGETFGLFGYTKDAVIQNVTIDNSDITGNAYQKTLPTESKSEGNLATTSGGEYDWSDDDMKWEGKATNVGVIVGNSTGTTISNCTAQNVQMNIASGNAYAAGIVGVSQNDNIRDVQVLSCTIGSTGSGASAGLVGKATGSKIYKSFVRGGTLSGVTGNGSLFCDVNKVEAYGCYTQGVGGGHGAAVVNSTDCKFVGCYTTQGSFLWGNDSADQCFNCYYQASSGGESTVNATDTVVGLAADTLKSTTTTDGTLTAIAAMNAELMGVEGTDKDNDSGFKWTEYGSAIVYVADSTGSNPPNGGYPVHGTAHFVEIKVVDGQGYGKGTLSTGTGIYPVTETDSYASYWVVDNTSVTLKGEALNSTSLSTASATKKIGTGTEETITSFSASDLEESVGAITGQSVIKLTFVPNTYTYYTLDLKAGDGSQSVPSTTSSSPVKLSGTEVNRYTSTTGAIADVTGLTPSNNVDAIQTIILTIDNGGTLTVPDLPSTWGTWTTVKNKDGKQDVGYYHFQGDAITADEVKAFLQEVSVTPGSAANEYRVSAFIYESTVPYIASNYNGHFYQYIPTKVKWADAVTGAKDYVTALGKADTYLATIATEGEGDYLYGTLKAYNAWMGAISYLPSGTTVAGVTDPKGVWTWVTGPEAGDALSYTNWAPGEPNNYGNNEWAAAFAYNGWDNWNDFDGARTDVCGYLVEYQAGEKIWGANYANDAFVYTKEAASGGGGGGGGGSSTVEPTQPVQPADPDDTGVSKLLNTEDHICYLHGYPKGDFRPEANMTRAEVAQMFFNLLLDQSVSGSASFKDVKSTAWYSEAVLALANLEILQGVGNDKYEPDRNVTREEFAAIALRFAEQLTEGATQFSDVTPAMWSYDYIMAATGYGWITGYPDGTYRPEGDITRAEVTAIVNKMLGRSADEAYVDAHLAQMVTFPDVAKSHWAYYPILEATNDHDYSKDSAVETWSGLNQCQH